MGNLIFNMYKFASLVGLTAANSWFMECDFKSHDYDQYKFFPVLLKEVDCRDICMSAHSYMFSKSDLNNDLVLDKCEMTYGCIGSQKFDDPAECVKMADEMGEIVFEDVIK